MQLDEGIGGSDVDAGDRFGRDDEPRDLGRSCGCCGKNAFLEKLRVGEEQRRVPPKQQQARQLARVGIADDVVIAPHAFRAAEDSQVGALVRAENATGLGFNPLPRASSLGHPRFLLDRPDWRALTIVARSRGGRAAS